MKREIIVSGSKAALCAGFCDTFLELKKNPKNKWIPNPYKDLPTYKHLYDMGIECLNKADWSNSKRYDKSFLTSLIKEYEEMI